MLTTFYQVALPLVILISIIAAFQYGGKKKKIGCAGRFYIFLCCSSLGLLCFILTPLLIKIGYETIHTYMNGQEYMATLISYSEYESKDEDGESTTMYTPEYEIQLSNNEKHHFKASTSSSSKPIIGSTTKAYYNETNKSAVDISFSNIAFYIMGSLFCLILTFSFVGAIMYSFNANMTSYLKIAKFIGLGFLIPLIMIAFDGALIYALLFNDDMPFVIIIIVIIFILVLTLGTIGYIKQLISHGVPTLERTSDTSWSGDWEDEENEEDKNKKTKKKSKPQKKDLIPLNEDLLNKKD